MTQELIRQYVDLAVGYGRSLQSEQTGFLHYCIHPKSIKEVRDTIPVYENLLFVLALLRSKQAEQMNEAKALLTKLIAFQSSQRFPVYLHEYPTCHDLFLGVYLLAPFYWIKKLFHSILGADLNQQIDNSIQTLLQSYLTPEQTVLPKYPVALQLATAALAIGDLYQNTSFQNEGQERLKNLLAEGPNAYWYSPHHLGTCIASLQMVYPNLKDSPWKNLWDHFEKTWHSHTHAYIGPGYDELFDKEQPQVTLYDYVGGLCSKKLASRCLKPNHALLQAILLQENADSIHFKHDKHYVYSVIQNELPLPSKERSFHPFKLIWGDLKHTHSLVLQGRNPLQFSDPGNNTLFLHLNLAEIPDLEYRERSREVTLYCDANEKTRIYVNGVTATTFQMNDEIKIESGDLIMTLVFTLEEGTGEFLGHLMPGNRLSQYACKHEFPYQAFDRQIFLRTIRRDNHCRIGVKLRFHERIAHESN